MAHGNEEALIGNTNAVKFHTRNKSIKVYLYPDELELLQIEAAANGYKNVMQYARDKLTNSLINNKETEAITESLSDMDGWHGLSQSQQQACIEMHKLNHK